MELTFFKFGPIVRRHQQFLPHQGFGGAAVVDSLEAHDKQRLAGQLPAFFELDFRGFTTFAAA